MQAPAIKQKRCADHKFFTLKGAYFTDHKQMGINSMKFRITSMAAVLMFASSLAMAQAPSDNAVELTVQNHQFMPASLTIAADTKVKITLHNLDSSAAEFISDEFKGGKLVGGGKTASFFIGPLKSGTYEFHDEYHEDVSKTQLIVK
ncbi:MAG: plastocyanin [Pseudomonas sp.]